MLQETCLSDKVSFLCDCTGLPCSLISLCISTLIECLNLFHSVKVVTQYLHLLQKEYKQFVFFNPMFWVRNENYCMCCCALQNVDLILASQSLGCSLNAC